MQETDCSCGGLSSEGNGFEASFVQAAGPEDPAVIEIFGESQDRGGLEFPPSGGQTAKSRVNGNSR